MALKEKWIDKIDGVDVNSAEDINQVAHAVIDLENSASNITSVDDTLTVAGAAADAKAVGDRFDAQQEQIDHKQPIGDYALKNEIPVRSVNGKTGAVQLAAADVGADAAGTADSKVGEHNVSENAHNDIRLLISGLSSRLNAIANSTDEDLDQLAEIVAYIKNNKSLIDAITTSKVSVSDIVNNLTTNVTNKPLSAAQGVALKALIDALTTTVSGKEASGTAARLINRSTAVNAADTNYTTLMARGSSLNSAETTPAVNGAIAWTYE